MQLGGGEDFYPWVPFYHFIQVVPLPWSPAPACLTFHLPGPYFPTLLSLFLFPYSLLQIILKGERGWSWDIK